MKNLKTLGIYLLVMGMFLVGAGSLSQAEEVSLTRIFSGSINGGLSQSFLDIDTERECDTCTGGAVDYKTEGVALYRIYGSVNVWKGPVFDFEYEQPFKKSDNQSALLSANKSKDSTYEKLTSGLLSDSIVDHYLTGDEFSTKIIKRLLSLKYKFTREAFFGKAKPTTNVIFVPKGTIIDYANSTITNGTNFTSNDELTFKTVFTDSELSMGVYNVPPVEYFLSPSVVRVGYYWTKWERLSDTQISSLSGIPIIYEAEYKSQGILIALDPSDKNAPGLNVNAVAKFGTNDSINSAIDWNQVTNSDADVQTLMLKFSLWYNYYLNKESKDGLAFTAGGSLDMRKTTVKNDFSAVQVSAPASENQDNIFKYFVSAGYRF